jgi:predicted RNase H-like HicB family nuclease
MDPVKIIIEKHSDGYVSYPIGLKGVVVNQGDTYEEALADIRSAINFHIETFGAEAFENDSSLLWARLIRQNGALANDDHVDNLLKKIYDERGRSET